MIFLSWSKKLSKQLAECTENFFSTLLDDKIIFWMSNEIKGGSIFFAEIVKKLRESVGCIVFLTSENVHNPWINFEVGAFTGKNNTSIFPILFDSTRPAETCRNTPFEGLQVYEYGKESLLNVFLAICEIEETHVDLLQIREKFETLWSEYNDRINQIIAGDRNVDSSATLADVRFDFTKNWALECNEGQILDFGHGFETHELYRYVLANAKKRIWIYGRKNKKVFDNSFIKQFQRIGKAIKEDGFSFRCLFFSPDSSPEVTKSAQKKSNFPLALQASLSQCIDVLEECDIDKSCLRFYNAYRNEAIIIMDNIVFFTPVKYDVDGKPYHLTDTSFFACAINSGIGKYSANIFQKVWDNAKRFEEIE